MNVIEEAAKAGFEFDGRFQWEHLLPEEKEIKMAELRASIRFLADHPDVLTVLEMTQNGKQEKRIREGWKRLCLGLLRKSELEQL